MTTEALIDVKISARSELADGIIGLELEAANGNALPPFTAGSHIDLHLNGGLIRQYSLHNAPGEEYRYCLGVLREEEGRGGSKAVHDLAAGARLRISAPRNHFALVAGARHSVLIAGGIGITPILSMAQALYAQGASFELHYCARNEARMAFREELQNSAFAECVHLHFDDGADSQKFDISGLETSPADGTNLYVCGPGGFMNAVLSAAEPAWPAGTVHREFFAADTGGGEGEDRAFKIQVASTGQIIDVPADRPAVEVLAELGFDIPTSCEQGICGTCITKVIGGVPDHRDLVLTEEEHAENSQMAVCCSRAVSDLLVLDL